MLRRIKSILFSWATAFYTFMAILAVLAALWLQDRGTNPIAAILMSACSLAFIMSIISISAWGFWLAKMCLFYGAPYKSGDKVEITTGTLKGSQGEVVTVAPDQYFVTISVNESSQTMPWGDFRKLRKR